MNRLFLLLMLLLSVHSFAQNDPDAIVEDFFNNYSKDKSDTALDKLFGTNEWMKESSSQIDNVKFKLNGTLKQIGKYYGYSLITKKSIGEHLVLHTYLVRHDRQPLRFSFLFYRPNNTWRLQNFRYDDSIDDELDEAAKGYRLKENLN